MLRMRAHRLTLGTACCLNVAAPAGEPTFPRCARRERSQPLPGSIIEYIVHGEFAWQEDDTNSTYGAWWVPLRSMVEEVGKEEVEQKLDEFDAEVKRLRSLVIDAVANSSEDEVQGEDE